MITTLRRSLPIVLAVAALLCVILVSAQSEARNRRMHAASLADRADLRRRLDAAARDRDELRIRHEAEHRAVMDALRALAGPAPATKQEADQP